MRTIGLYLAFVGTPLLILLGILKAGAGLEAPASLAGGWMVYAQEPADTAGAAERACGLALPDRDAELRIEQSGPFLELRFNDRAQTTLSARLAGDSLAGRAARQPTAACPASALELTAIIAPHGKPNRMSGQLAWVCPSEAPCPPLDFQAVRRPRPRARNLGAR